MTPRDVIGAREKQYEYIDTEGTGGGSGGGGDNSSSLDNSFDDYIGNIKPESKINNNSSIIDEQGGDDPNPNRNPKQDKKLTPGEIEKMKKAGWDHGDKKSNGKGGGNDLWKDKKGNVYEKPKSGAGYGEWTGYNLNHLALGRLENTPNGFIPMRSDFSHAGRNFKTLGIIIGAAIVVGVIIYYSGGSALIAL